LGKRLEKAAFPESVDNMGIRQPEKVQFGSLDKRSGVGRASYRRVSVYTKSVVRYKLERERRRQVRVLAEEGFTQKQIAVKLGVSTRTVKRDWGKVQSYLKWQFDKEIGQAAEEKSLQVEGKFDGLTLKEELKLLKKDIKRAKKRRAVRRLTRRQKRLIEDLEAALSNQKD